MCVTCVCACGCELMCVTCFYERVPCVCDVCVRVTYACECVYVCGCVLLCVTYFYERVTCV